jgi:circadian clock protein KaiC
MVYVGGYHDFCINTGGLTVYPRIRMGIKPSKWKARKVASGNRKIDTLLGGGLEGGTSCLIIGTSGAGKSTLASLYVEAAAKRNTKSVIFCFDEHKQTFLRRCNGLGMNMPKYIDKGLVDLKQMNIGECSVGQFAETIRNSVENESTRMVVIDSLTGFLAAMVEQKQLIPQLHELINYLSGAGVLTLMIISTHGVIGSPGPTIDASYLADTVVLMRHFEAMGKMRRCISVLKKRHGHHETTIREVEIGPGGVRLGPPLTEFSAILTGTPRFDGVKEKLLNELSK